MNSDNPYASPAADSDLVVAKAVETQTLGAIARATFLAWEELRLIYIAFLAVVVLLLGLLGGPGLITSLHFWIVTGEGAVVANLCFFAGPVIETYVSWLGFRTKGLRVVLFVAGTVFACLLATGVIVFELLTLIG